MESVCALRKSQSSRVIKTALSDGCTPYSNLCLTSTPRLIKIHSSRFCEIFSVWVWTVSQTPIASIKPVNILQFCNNRSLFTTPINTLNPQNVEERHLPQLFRLLTCKCKEHYASCSRLVTGMQNRSIMANKFIENMAVLKHMRMYAFLFSRKPEVIRFLRGFIYR